METEQVDVHQSLMDSAYDKYQANESWSYNEFITSLDYKEKVAVLTGNLNYQVGNGGFMQWYDNGYSSEADQLIIILEKYKDGSPAIAKVLQLVQEVVDTIKSVERESSKSSRYSWDDEDEDEDEDDTWRVLSDKLNPLQNEYYKIDDDFLVAVGEVLLKI